MIEAEAESEIRHLPSPTSPGEEAEIVIGREDDISEREMRRIQDKWRDILREEKDWPGHQHQYDIVVSMVNFTYKGKFIYVREWMKNGIALLSIFLSKMIGKFC